MCQALSQVLSITYGINMVISSSDEKAEAQISNLPGLNSQPGEGAEFEGRSVPKSLLFPLQNST